MPNGTLPLDCVLVKLPIVLADVPGSISVDNVTCLEEVARKVDHIDVVVRDLEADPHFTTEVGCNSPKATIHFGEPQCGPSFIRSITIHGEIHKQIYYVNKDDDVRHMAEDIPFTKNIVLNPPLPVSNPGNVDIDFRNVDVNVDFELPRASRIQQVATISFVLKITEDQQVFIRVCPSPDQICGPELVADPSLENWLGDNTPVAWSASNVVRSDTAHTGTYSAQLGDNRQESANLSQTINATFARAGLNYRMCFWARSVAPEAQIGTQANQFTLTAELVFFDANGNRLAGSTVTRTGTELSNGWQQICAQNVTAPEGTALALVSFLFEPNNVQPPNGSAVLIDDVSVMCMS